MFSLFVQALNHVTTRECFYKRGSALEPLFEVVVEEYYKVIFFLKLEVGHKTSNHYYLLEIKASAWNEYVFVWMCHPTYVISLSPQAK